MASTDARPIPIKNTAFRAVFPILDADGDLVTGATGLDSEVSKDQGTFADCTNEATEIATASGMYYLDLTSTEMNADCVAVIVKTTSTGAKTTVLVFYPEEAGDINVDVTAWNGTAVSSPATAGIPEVNVKNINNVSASSVTTVNANQGTTQPVNFTGTGASALAKSDMVDVAGAAVSTSTAQLGVNVVNFGGSAGTFASGRPEVNTTHAAGTAWGSGAITAASIASAAITAAKFGAGAIDAAAIADGAIDRATFAADTGLQTIRSNTAQSGAAGSITLDASASATTDFYKGAWILITGGTGVGQTRLCTAYNGTSKAATVTPNWATNPDNTSTFAVVPAAGVDLELIANAAVSTSTAQLGVNVVNNAGSAITAASGRQEVNVSHISGSAVSTSSAQLGVNVVNAGGTAWASGAITAAVLATDCITAAKVAADAIGASELAADAATEIATAVWASATRTLTALGFTLGASDLAADTITAAKIATDAIGSAELASTAITEIVNGVLDELLSGHTTAGTVGKAISDIDTHTDTETSAAAIRAAVGLASANLDTQLTAIDDYIDTEVAAIKAKTDLIPASPAATSDIPSAATIADAVWDEALSGHTTAGSGGKALSDIDTHTDTETGAAAIRAAVGLASANLDTQLAAVQADTDDIQTRLPAALVSGRIDASVGAMAANVVTASAIATDAIGAAELAADAVTEIQSGLATAASIAALNNISQADVRTAVGLASANLDTQLDALPTNAELATALASADDAVIAAIAALNNLSSSAAATAVLTTAMTESYAADGAAPTLAQAIYMIQQRLTEFVISGTTISIKKLDGTTEAATLTLDSATDPTSTTRAT